MNARTQVLEAELKTVQAVRLTIDPAVSRAAAEREEELLAELRRAEDNGARAATAWGLPPSGQ